MLWCCHESLCWFSETTTCLLSGSGTRWSPQGHFLLFLACGSGHTAQLTCARFGQWPSPGRQREGRSGRCHWRLPSEEGGLSQGMGATGGRLSSGADTPTPTPSHFVGLLGQQETSSLCWRQSAFLLPQVNLAQLIQGEMSVFRSHSPPNGWAPTKNHSYWVIMKCQST